MLSAFLVTEQAVCSKDYRPWKIDLRALMLNHTALLHWNHHRIIRTEYCMCFQCHTEHKDTLLSQGELSGYTVELCRTNLWSKIFFFDSICDVIWKNWWTLLSLMVQEVAFSRKAVLERSGRFIPTYLHKSSCFPVTVPALFLIADVNKDLVLSQLALVNGHDVRTNF